MNGGNLMNKLLTSAALALLLVASSNAFAGERTVTLAVQDMFCDACPLIVRKSLEAVPGVAKVTVSFKDKRAIVTYDDAKTDVNALTAAATNAGYPSAPKG
jgi:periplasmic mercuric ion binding protein